MKFPLSLKRRLLLWLGVALVALVPVGSLGLYVVMLNTAVTWLDQALGDTALAVGSFIRVRDGELGVEVSGPTDRALRFDRLDRIYYLVLDPSGKPLIGDGDLLPPTTRRLEPGEWQFEDIVVKAEPLRLATLGVECIPGLAACQVRVAETTKKRAALRRELLLAASVTMLLVTIALSIAGRAAIVQGLRPLDRLSAEMEQRNLERLEPVGDRVPDEVRPLVSAINRLFERLRGAASAQQDFLANAAHQMRTPLTALRTEIDLALLEPHDPQIDPLLQRLQKTVDRSARVAQQMLTLARADAAQASGPVQRMDLRDIAAQAAEEWVPRAMAASVDLGFELQSAPVNGQAFLLRELLENLIHNSLAHAGAGTRVTVRTLVAGGHSVLEVEDTGPGIPEADRTRVVERFQRGPGARSPGSGLGLAIAHDVALRHGGSLSLLDGEDGRGLRVRVELPLA